MVKDYLDGNRGNLLQLLQGLLVQIIAFFIPVVEHWVEQGIAQWVLQFDE